MAIHMVYGPPKRGKSLKLVDIFLNSVKDKERINLAKNSLISSGMADSVYTNFNHFTFVNQDFVFQERMKSLLHNHIFNPFQFALPNDKFETVFFPEYSTLIIDEAQKYYNSRKTVSSYVCNAFEMSGHMHYDIWLATQRPKMVDLRIRELICDFKFIDSVDFVVAKNGIQTIINTIEHDNCYAVEQFVSSGYTKPAGVRKTYKIDLDLRNCYDAFCYSSAFYNFDSKLKVKLYDNTDSSDVLSSDYIVPKGFFE